MKFIAEQLDSYKVLIANRSEGSGIKIVNMETNSIALIKIYHSKTVQNRSAGYEHGYHIVRLEELARKNPMFCLFSLVDLHDKWHFLVFNTADIFDYYDRKKYDSDELQLYFSIQGNNAYELRGDEREDVTKHLENWEILGC
jgi:hypothetical protein